ncbi:MAG: DUF3078 domain-containing protein [Bacteroidales bacterium]
MKKYIILAGLLVWFPFTTHGQESTDSLEGWKTGGAGSLAFSQVSLVNWASGGANSIAGNAFVNMFANLKKGQMTWDNNLDMGYGLLNNEGQGVRKSDDRLEFSSKYGRKAPGKWYYSGMVGFKTQFADGYDYPNDSTVISSFFAPAYITASLGMDYKPGDNFTLFLSPLTSKTTIVIDPELATGFGLEPGKKIRGEFGGYYKMAFKTPVVTNVDLLTKLDLFSNYLDKPQNVDVNWEVLITMTINQYISANINTHLIYDDNIRLIDDDGIKRPKVQFKEVFGLGFSCKF